MCTSRDLSKAALYLTVCNRKVGALSDSEAARRIAGAPFPHTAARRTVWAGGPRALPERKVRHFGGTQREQTPYPGRSPSPARSTVAASQKQRRQRTE